MKLIERRPGLVVLLAAVVLLTVAAGCGKRVRPAPRVEVTTPSEPCSRNVVISYVLYDTESWPAKITVSYSLDGGLNFSDATKGPGGDGVTGLLTNERGIAHSFVWDSITDAGYVNEENVRISITATTRKTSLASTTANFVLENFVWGEWELNIRVDDDTGTAAAESPGLAAKDDTVYAVWIDYRSGDADIYFTFSVDAGTTWATPAVRVDQGGTANQIDPSIATDGAGTVYVVWTDYRDIDSSIRIATGYDSGGVFVFPVDAEVSHTSSLSAVEPVIAVEGSTIYVAWTDSQDGDRDVFFRRSTNGGVDWEAEKRVNNAAADHQYEPSIAADGSGNVYLAWTDHRNIDSSIFMATGNAGTGFAFAINTEISSATSVSAVEPVVAVEGSNIYLAWADARNGDRDIYFVNSSNSGTTWEAEILVNDDGTSTNQYEPALAVNSSTGEICLVFTDERSDGPSIYFTSGTAPVVSFTANVRIDDDAGSAAQLEPVIVCGSRVFIAFTDGRNIDNDIYFTRRPEN